MLVVKDHYSMLSDKQYPTFVLRDSQRGSGREVWSWGDQMDQLFIHKMSEVLRVLMIFKLLWTGPEVERGSIDIYNKVEQCVLDLDVELISMVCAVPSTVCPAKLSILAPGAGGTQFIPTTGPHQHPL